MESKHHIDRFAELLERSGIDPNDLERIDRMNVWQGFIKNSDEEIETVDLYGLQAKPHVNPEDIGLEVVPAKITPSRRKSVPKNHEDFFVFGDAQIDYRNINGEFIPIHDERAMRVARFICRDLEPDIIINLGDTVDLANLSRFPKDSNHFQGTLQRSFQRVHDYYAELRADHPNARIVEVDSNHNTRLGKFVLRQVPELYGLRQANTPEGEYPILSYPHIVQLGHLAVEWVSGYGAAEFRPYDDIGFIHGTNAVPRGSTAAKTLRENPDTNIVQGHAHRMESFYRTNREGAYIGAFVVGALCRIDGIVPAYHSAIDDTGMPVKRTENWQQGVMHIRKYGAGEYEFNHIPIRDGVAHYRGREYDGNES